MSEETAVVRRETAAVAPLDVTDVVGQVKLVQEIMSKVMKDGEHYGVIPGCDKPSLYQPGAQKLALTFRYLPRYEIEKVELPDDHREYEVTCILEGPNAQFLGSGSGNCNTMEAKYRYRSQNTGQPVPKEYWETRDADILGGPQFSPRKVKGSWIIFEKMDHDNPADYWNTVKKMACKRAFVHAVIGATAASDLFTQDVEDLDALQSDMKETAQEPEDKPFDAPKKKAASGGGGGTISDKQRKLLFARMKSKDMSDEQMKALVFAISGKEHTKDVQRDDMDTLLEAIDGWEQAIDMEPGADEELPFDE